MSLLLCLAVSALAQSACPSASDRFGPPGTDGAVHDLIVFDDGPGPALYAGGAFGAAGSTRAALVARFDGTQWSRVGDLAPATTGDIVNDLEVFDDGAGARLYAARSGAGGVVRWNGQTWEDLGPGIAGTLIGLNALAVFDSGNGPHLYAGGSRYDSQFNTVPFLARFDGGTTWVEIQGAPTFQSYYGDAWINALCTYDSGSGRALYVGGVFDKLGNGAVCFSLARYDGQTWSAVGVAGVGGVNLHEGVQTMAVFDDGTGSQLYFGGNILPFWGANVQYLARWNGSSFSSPPQPVASPISRLQVMPACGDVPAGLWALGTSNLFASPPTRAALWNGGPLVPIPGCSLAAPESVQAVAGFDSGNGSEAYVGGNFRTIDATHAWNVSRRSAGSWTRLTGGEGVIQAADTSVTGTFGVSLRAFALHDDGSGPALFAAGADVAFAGDQSIGCVARWNGTGWSALGDVRGEAFALTSFDFGQGPELVAMGLLRLNGAPQQKSFPRWNGATWSELPPTPGSSLHYGMAVFDSGLGSRLYCGGEGLYCWNGVGWNTIANGTVRALLVHDDGSGPALFVGGRFALAGALGSPNLVRFDGTSFGPVGAGVGQYPGSDGFVSTLARFDDGSGARLVVGGSFSTASGVSANNVASWNGSTWSAMGLGLWNSSDVFPVVRTLAVFDDGQGGGPALFAGGAFTNAESLPASGLARWNGSSWSEALGGARGPFGSVETMIAVNDVALGGPALYVGGGFSALGDTASSRIAAWKGCDATGRLFCFGDGSGTACPCGNASAPSDMAGCLHSLGQGGVLRARGVPSLADDSVELLGSAMPNSAVLYFQGASVVNGGAGVVFGDGVKCTSGPFVRLRTKSNVTGASSYPGPNELPVSQKGLILSPGTRHYQLRYRNAAAFCTSDTFNYTNGLSLVWTP